jgi:uncharacterized protein YjbJ (UPF0337 family)
MGFLDKIKNTFQHTTGEGKEAVGDITNDNSTKFEGKADQAEASAKDKVADVKDQLNN